MAKGNKAEEAQRYPCHDRSGNSKATPSHSRSMDEEVK